VWESTETDSQELQSQELNTVTKTQKIRNKILKVRSSRLPPPPTPSNSWSRNCWANVNNFWRTGFSCSWLGRYTVIICCKTYSFLMALVCFKLVGNSNQCQKFPTHWLKHGYHVPLAHQLTNIKRGRGYIQKYSSRGCKTWLECLS